jgi:hypothetical protein
MKYPIIIYADTDLVCSEEPNILQQPYIKADDNTTKCITDLIQLIEGPRSGRWGLNAVRLKDTKEWCAFYVAMAKIRFQ